MLRELFPNIEFQQNKTVTALISVEEYDRIISSYFPIDLWHRFLYHSGELLTTLDDLSEPLRFLETKLDSFVTPEYIPYLPHERGLFYRELSSIFPNRLDYGVGRNILQIQHPYICDLQSVIPELECKNEIIQVPNQYLKEVLDLVKDLFPSDINLVRLRLDLFLYGRYRNNGYGKFYPAFIYFSKLTDDVLINSFLIPYQDGYVIQDPENLYHLLWAREHPEITIPPLEYLGSDVGSIIAQYLIG